MIAKYFERWPWLPFVLPLAVFLIVQSIEPAAVAEAATRAWLPFRSEHYPLFYTAKIALVALALVIVRPVFRQFPFGVTPLGILVGVVGGAAWIYLCELDLEEQILPAIGLESWLGGGVRASYNPFDGQGGNALALYGFLAVRFLGLAIIVPVIEELFLRGFLMRYITSIDWQRVPFGTASTTALVVGTAFPLLTHPASEAIAVLVWFSLVTWLMVRTRSLWDCMAAHAITNLMLGIYVVNTGSWELW